MGWREIVVVALATTSGFTFALFFAAGLLPAGALLMQIKMGTLLTVAGALATLAVARILRVGPTRPITVSRGGPSRLSSGSRPA